MIAAGVHHAARRCSGGVAARGASAAVQQFDDDRVPGEGTPSAHGPLFAAFVKRLRELGWVEGHTIAIELRWGEGRSERFAEFAAEFVRLKVDVIVASGTANVLAAKQATAVIPIVAAAAGNPIGSGLVASLGAAGWQRHRPVNSGGRPRWQATRTFARSDPSLGRLAIMSNVNNPSVVLETGETQGRGPHARP